MASVLEYALKLDTQGFTRPLSDAKNSLSGMGGAASQVGSLISRIPGIPPSLAAGATQGATALSSLRGAAGGAAASMGTVVGATGLAVAGVAALAIGATAASKAVLSGYAEYDGLVRGLGTLENSSADTAARLDVLREVAKAPGLGFEEAVRGDIRLRSVGISADLSAKAMKAFGNAIATVGGGKAELDGVMTALMQIQAKGKVSAEEVNQLAERAPQVRAAMQEAFGTSDVEELGKKGIDSAMFIERIVEVLLKLPMVTGGARNVLDNYDDAWKELKNTALEFGVTMAGDWLNTVTGAVQIATEQLKELQKFLGISTPGLEGTETQGDTAWQKAKQAREKNQADQLAADQAVINANFAFWNAKAEERMAAERDAAAARVEVDAAANRSTWAAQEAVFAARLTREQDLQRQIANLRREGPASADAVNNAPSATAAAAVAARIAKISGAEKELAQIRKAAADQQADKDKAAAQLAKDQAESAAKQAEALAQARRAFSAETQILSARVAGNTRLAEQLERQARIEELKLRIMQDQGKSEKEALAMAQKRTALQEALDKAAAPHQPARERIQKEREQRQAEHRLANALRPGDARPISKDDRAQLNAIRQAALLLRPARAAAALERGRPAADPAQPARNAANPPAPKTDPALQKAVDEISEILRNLTKA